MNLHLPKFLPVIVAASVLMPLTGCVTPISTDEPIAVTNPTSTSSNPASLPSATPSSTKYVNATGDLSVSMPGEVTETSDGLTSYSKATQTEYVVLEVAAPPEVQQLSNQEIQTLLQSALPAGYSQDGTVVDSQNLGIAGYPGFEAIVQYADGKVGDYRMAVVDDRMFFQGAVTKGQFTAETQAFFDSFALYTK